MWFFFLLPFLFILSVLSFFCILCFFRLLSLFFYWNFSLLCPFLDKTTIIEYYKAILSIFKFELDSKYLFLWILRLCDIVSYLLFKANNCWFVFDQNFDGLFSREFNSLTWRNFASSLEYHFSLLNWISFCIRP